MSDYENIQTHQIPTESSQGFSGGSAQAFNRGGVLEYRVESQVEQPLAIQRPNVQANLGGITTVTAGGSTQHQAAVSTFNTADISGGYSDFLATAHNNGLPAMGNLKASSVVTYQGMEVDLGTLESMGIVRSSGNGYEVVEQAQQAGQPSQTDLPGGIQQFPDEVESSVAAAIEPVPQATYDAALAMAVAGGLDSINFNDLAYQSGITPEDARQRAEMVSQAFDMQAMTIAQSAGVQSVEDAWNWAVNNRPEQLADARRQMVFARNTAPLRGLISEYLRNR